MLLGDDHEAQGCKAKIFARGVIMEEGGDATWLSPIVTALRGLFQNGESRPRVAIVVAVGDGPGIAAAVPTPDPAVLAGEAVGAERGSSYVSTREASSGADSEGTVPWEEVSVAFHGAGHATGRSSMRGPEVDDDLCCRHCGSGIVHRPGDCCFVPCD